MSEQQHKHSTKIFWIFGLVCMITLSINQNTIIPIGLVILLILIAFKKNYQETLKANMKQGIILILVGLFLAYGGMGLILDITKNSEKVGVNFNLQLIPGKYISPIVGLFVDKEKLAQKMEEENSKIINDIRYSGCKLLIDDIVDKYNNQDFTGLDTLLYHDDSVIDEDRKKILDQFPKIRELIGSLSGLQIISLKSYENNNLMTVQTINQGETENYGATNDIKIGCVYNNNNQKRERTNINIGTN